MDWRCPNCRGVLERSATSVDCSRCGRGHPIVAGAPVFSSRLGPERPIPALLAELSALLRHESCEPAGERLAKRHQHPLGGHSTGWTGFFSPPPTGPVLELGAGFGDDSLTLAGRGTRVLSLVPDRINAQVLSLRLAQQRGAGVEVAVVDDLARLPLADRSVAGIAFEDAAAAGFGLGPDSLPAVAREWRRVLMPDSVLLIGLSNPAGGLVRALLDGPGGLLGPRRERLNRALKRRPAWPVTGSLSPGLVLRSLLACGLGRGEIYAPLPDEERPAYVVPIGDREAIRYFLGSLVRKDSPALLTAARAAARWPLIGRLRHLVPYCYLIFGAGPAGAERP